MPKSFGTAATIPATFLAAITRVTTDRTGRTTIGTTPATLITTPAIIGDTVTITTTSRRGCNGTRTAIGTGTKAIGPNVQWRPNRDTTAQRWNLLARVPGGRDLSAACDSSRRGKRMAREPSVEVRAPRWVYFLSFDQKLNRRDTPAPLLRSVWAACSSPLSASASCLIDCVMAALGACSYKGTPLLRVSTIVR